MSISSLARPDPTFPSAASPLVVERFSPPLVTITDTETTIDHTTKPTYLTNRIHATTTSTPRPRLRLRHGHHQWLDLILTTTLLTCSSIVKLLIR